MERKLWGLLSGTHITIIIAAVVLAIVPGSLWAVDAFTNVAIQDPFTGKKAFVDNARRLYVLDQIGVADELPGNMVRFSTGPINATFGCLKIATPPAGKGLVVKSAFFDISLNPIPSHNDLGILFVGATSCENQVLSLTPPDTGPERFSFEPGVVVPPGQSLWVQIFGSINTRVAGTGYLVPGAWAPPSPSIIPAQAAAARQ